MIETSVPSEHGHDTRERSRRSGLSKQICQLVLSRNVDHRNDRPLDQVLNDHKPQLKVLRPITKFPRIIGKLPRGSVVFISPNRVRRKPNFGEEFTDKAGLVSAIGGGYDFGLATALRNDRLALAFPRGRTTIEMKDDAGRGLAGVFAVSPGGIGKEEEAVS